MKNINKTYTNTTFSLKNKENRIAIPTLKTFNHSKSDDFLKTDFIPREANNYKNASIHIARKEYFETLILDFKSRWDYQLITDFQKFNFRFQSMVEELESLLHTHSIFLKAKKYCSTIYKFKIESLNFSLEKYYSNYDDLKNSFEEKENYSFKINTKSGAIIRIKLFEGFIVNHPECISIGDISNHP